MMQFGPKKHHLASLKQIILWTIRSVLAIHIFYSYVKHFQVGEVIQKGGTYLEATDQAISFLPYLNQDNKHIIIQNLLFPGCLEPIFSGINITYNPDLCKITTNNHKVFTVEVNENSYRSDGTAISLDDIYFTYKTILKENFWNKAEHEGYKSINIEALADKIIVSFPYASIDNESFFTQSILPAHRLANLSYAEYLQEFGKDPIFSSCARKKDDNNDASSIIIDLTRCEESPHKYYQIKQFSNMEGILSYVQKNPDTIDAIISNDISTFSGSEYLKNSIRTQSFYVSFFNEQKSTISLENKEKILALFQKTAGLLSGDIIVDSYIFENNKDDISLYTGLLEDQVDVKYLPTNLPDIIFFSGSYHQSYTISKNISDKLLSTFIFPNDRKFEKITISHNKDDEIVLGNYNTINNSVQYGFSPILRNISTGFNTYTIQGYSGDKVQDNYNFTIFYGPRSGNVVAPKENNSGDNLVATGNSIHEIIDLPREFILPIHIVYFNNPDMKLYVDILEKELMRKNLDKYFRFESIDDINIYEGRLQSKDYDIVLSELRLGLRKDISNIFLSDIPKLNPSLYINQSLSAEISKYFLASGKTKQESYNNIQSNYKASIPLGFIGKKIDTILTKKDIKSLPYRLPSLGRRKSIMNQSNTNIGLSSIAWDKALSWSGFVNYFSSLSPLSQ